MTKKKFILKITCHDKAGILSEVTTKIYELGGFLIAADQFSDPDTNQFFMRICFETTCSQSEISQALQPTCEKFQIEKELHDSDYKPNLLILCSKKEHCLNHLLEKWKNGGLKVNIPAIVSNHTTLKEIADWHNIPFYHLPITPEAKSDQEDQIRELVKKYNIEYLIMARYMQILSPEMCNDFAGRIINIHHSFLPGFKGANPYRQAYERGVKVIGATAHFATPNLDEGPIITQETIRVSHAHSVDELARYGADIESVVLTRAVKKVTELRVFTDNHKTVVFK